MEWLEGKIAPNRKVALWRRRLLHRYRLWKRPNYPLEDTRKLVAELFPTLRIDSHSVVLDFGCNEGAFSLLFGQRGARVLAFEPNPWVARKASKRLGHLENVTLVTAAVGPTSSMATLYFPEEYRRAPELHSGSASLESTNKAVDVDSGIPVFQVGVVDVLNSFDKIDLLKIDIEGSESLLWPEIEAQWEKIDYLAIETHENLLQKEEAAWLVRARSFIAARDLAERWRLDWP